MTSTAEYLGLLKAMMYVTERAVLTELEYSQFTAVICECMNDAKTFEWENISCVKRKVVVLLWDLHKRPDTKGFKNHRDFLKSLVWDFEEVKKQIRLLKPSFFSDFDQRLANTLLNQALEDPKVVSVSLGDSLITYQDRFGNLLRLSIQEYLEKRPKHDASKIPSMQETSDQYKASQQAPLCKANCGDPELMVVAKSEDGLVKPYTDSAYAIGKSNGVYLRYTPETNYGINPEGTTMDTNKAFETINYVYGNDVTALTTPQLIAAIKQAESERNALDGVKTPSKKIKAMQTDLDESIAKIVAVLDAKL